MALTPELGFEQWSWNTTARKLDDDADVYLGDVNGDGRLDMIAVGGPKETNAGYVYVSLNNLCGFPSWDWQSLGQMLQNGHADKTKNDIVRLADVDGDGKVDLVAQGGTGYANAGKLYVALSDGTGFPQWTWASPGRVIDAGSQVFFGKVNDDNRADLVAIGAAGTPHAGVVFVATSNGTGYPVWTWSSAPVAMMNVNSPVFLGFVNDDDRVDLIGVGAPGAGDAGRLYVATSNGTGYPSWTWNSPHAMVDAGEKTYVADVNGDQKPDIVSVGVPGTPTAGRVSVAVSNGTGYPSWTWRSANGWLNADPKIWFVDVDGNQSSDLVAQGAAGTPEAGRIFVASSNGTGFPSWTWDSSNRMVDDNSKVWFADMNNDRRTDLVAQGAPDNTANAGFVFVGLQNPGGNCPFSGGVVNARLYPKGELVLKKSCSPYLIDSSITVLDNRKLTIEPGVTLKFPSGGALLVGVDGPGKLSAWGSSSDPIRFTSQEEEPSPGSWRGLVFGSRTMIDSWLARAWITGAGQAQDGALVAHGLVDALALYSLNINKVGDGASGILVLGDQSRIPISDSTFWDAPAGRYPISVSAGAFASIGTGNLYPNGSAIEVMGGTIDTSVSWSNPGLPVAITNDLIIEGSDNPKLSVGSGMYLKFGPNVAVQVGKSAPGRMAIAGTSLSRVSLTSLASPPVPGSWAGLKIWEFGKVTLSYTDFRYGGSNSGDSLGNVTVESAAPTLSLSIDHSSFNDSLGWGLYVPCMASPQNAAIITVDHNTTYADNAMGRSGPGPTCQQ